MGDKFVMEREDIVRVVANSVGSKSGWLDIVGDDFRLCGSVFSIGEKRLTPDHCEDTVEMDVKGIGLIEVFVNEIKYAEIVPAKV